MFLGQEWNWSDPFQTYPVAILTKCRKKEKPSHNLEATLGCGIATKKEVCVYLYAAWIAMNCFTIESCMNRKENYIFENTLVFTT